MLAKHVTGAGTFVDDIALQGMLYAGFVRSPYAHARIQNIDLNNATQDCAKLVILGHEMKKYSKPIPTYLYTSGETRIPEWNCLAVDSVNFVGEPVAAVVADDGYIIEDVKDAIGVSYEPLPPIVDAELALQKESPLVHEHLGSNLAIKLRMKEGDLDEKFRKSSFIIKRRFKVHRHATAAIEPRGAVASYEATTEKLTLWASTQIPFILRSHLSQMIGISENRIRVIAPDVGGGFGGKLQLAPEYVTLCVLSMLAKKPVKWIETRSENLASFAHAREQLHNIEAAFAEDGKLLAIKDRAIMDAGAYLDSRLSGQAVCALYELQGPYTLEAIDAEMAIVLTNKCPYGAYRGFGLETGVFIVERLMNIAARKLGLDPVEIRRKNLIKPSQMPYKTLLGLTYDVADYERTLGKGLQLAEYEQLRASQADLGKNGPHVGIGLSIVVEPSSTNAYTGVVEPTEITSSVDFGGARVKVDPSGSITVFLGTSSVGTGHDEAVRAIISEQLGVRGENIEVVEGDTDLTPYDCGVRASRYSTVVLPAALEATKKVKERLVKTAANMLEASQYDMEVSNGKFYVKGSPNVYITIEDVVRVFYADVDRLPQGVEPTLDVTCVFRPEKKGMFNTFSHAVHIPVIEFEPETGTCKFLKYLIVEDCGKIVNQEVVDGQLVGGLAQVIGGIFFEEMKYDEDGQLLTGTFAEYLIPTAVDIPTPIIIEHTVTPSTFPGGFKGMAESSNVCGYAAIVNAVDDALLRFDKEINYTYLSPERLWRLINSRE